MYEIDPSSNLCLAITQELFLYCDYYALQPRQEKDSNIIRIIIIPAIARFLWKFFSFSFLFASLHCGNMHSGPSVDDISPKGFLLKLSWHFLLQHRHGLSGLAHKANSSFQ